MQQNQAEQNRPLAAWALKCLDSYDVALLADAAEPASGSLGTQRAWILMMGPYSWMQQNQPLAAWAPKVLGFLWGGLISGCSRTGLSRTGLWQPGPPDAWILMKGLISGCSRTGPWQPGPSNAWILMMWPY